MTGFSRVALLQSHPRLPLAHAYYISDLVELCGLAACVRDQVEEVFIPVTPTDRDPVASFERFSRSHRPDLVGVSSFTSSAKSALAYAEIAKRAGAVVVMGGYHPSALPEEVLESPYVDIVVRGEGEETFRQIVAGDPVAEIAGISYRDNGSVIHNPDRPLIADLDGLPLPMRSIRPRRFGLAGRDYHTDTIYASRGCRAKCTFCANHLVGKTWRQRGIDRVLEELLTIPPPRKGPWKYVKFWDPNFMTDPDRVEELCDRILEHGLERHFRFIVETRVEDVIRARGILRKMRSAGFTRIGCGVESPHPQTHKLLKKGLNLSLVQQAAELVTSNHILFSKFLILGHVNESADDILEYPDYALSHGVDLQNTVFMVMTPYPGTPIAKEFEAQGRLRSYDWDLYTNFGAVVEPPGMSTLELQTLVCAVTARYGMTRRFLLGQRFSSVLGRLFEALLTHVMISRVNRDYSVQDIEDSLWQALVSMQGVTSRELDGERRATWTDRVALYIHHRNHAPVVIEVTRNGAQESLRVSVDGHARPGRRSIHLSTGRIVALAGSINLWRLGHDGLTFRWNPAAFSPRWLPTLATDLARLGMAGAGMVAFHARARRLRR
jgi:magnesium-protoporphyrin IX monomethyl ester (oxidative) cyclase